MPFSKEGHSCQASWSCCPHVPTGSDPNSHRQTMWGAESPDSLIGSIFSAKTGLGGSKSAGTGLVCPSERELGTATTHVWFLSLFQAVFESLSSAQKCPCHCCRHRAGRGHCRGHSGGSGQAGSSPWTLGPGLCSAHGAQSSHRHRSQSQSGRLHEQEPKAGLRAQAWLNTEFWDGCRMCLT